MPSIAIYIFPIAFVIMLPALIKAFKHKESSVLGWVTVSLFFLICANLSLISLATEIKHADRISCGKHWGGNSQLGGHCPLEYSNQTPLERVITGTFGGAFSGIHTVFFGIPLVIILSIIGLFKKRTRNDLYFSPYFAIVLMLAALVISLLSVSYFN